MKKLNILLLFLFLAVQLIGQDRPSKAQDKDPHAKAYKKALSAAVIPDRSEIERDLVPIRKNQEGVEWKSGKVLVLTWTNAQYYPKVGGQRNTAEYETWVMIPADFRAKMKGYKGKDLDLRIKQLLGLPPTASNTDFIELWVDPADLFRPCIDSEIDDQVCDISPKAEVAMDHSLWFNRALLTRYNGLTLYERYPWTQLGYTYDWADDSDDHRGVSEFVLQKFSDYEVKAITSTKDYLKE